MTLATLVGVLALLGVGNSAVASPAASGRPSAESAADQSADAAPGEDDTQADAAAPDDGEAPATDAAPTDADEDADPGEVADAPAEPANTHDEVADVPGPRVLDRVLPCGVRVIVAEDATLPVAAVVLAVERGSEDDPEPIPGLHHALAYQLLQGNRDLPPGGVAELVHDGGGVTSIATGPGQIRWESIVPVSTMAELIRAEAGRLRAPTVRDELWRDALIWARRDPARRWKAPRPAVGQAHGVPGLAHDGRAVSPALAKLEPRAVAAALADRFRYERATLVVVGPLPRLSTMALIDAHFSDLPARTRDLVDRTPHRGEGDAPTDVAVKGGDGSTFVWPVDPNPAAIVWAKVWCKTINRQRRDKSEPRRARLRCRLDEDPRRPIVSLIARGVDDPWALVKGRLAAIARGEESRLVQRQQRIVRNDLEFDLRSPLALASALARSAADAPRADPERPERPIDLMTGLHSLRDPDHKPDFPTMFPPGAAVRLVAPPED